jgi:hypothetical protein
MRLETEGFTRVATYVRSSAEPGDRAIVYNIAQQHVAAVLTVTDRAFVRSSGDDLDRWPFAIRTGRSSSRREVRSGRWPAATSAA